MEIARVQKNLAAKAQYQPTHRFDDLYRFVRDFNWLDSAHNAILHNSGAKTPGIDGVNGKELTPAAWRTLINQTVEELRDGTYHPQPARRIYIPKANGKLRPIGISTIRDRMVQEALRMVLEPIYESRFLDCSNGFRPGRSTMTAIHAVQRLCTEKVKHFWVVEGDLRSCFDEIPHSKLIQVLRTVIADERLLSLIWAFLQAGYVENGKHYTPPTGTPQGGVASPLLMNCYLHEFDMEWWRRYGGISRLEKERRRRHGLGNVSLLRYADDFLALTSGQKVEAVELKEELGAILSRLGLTLSAEKTLVTHVDDGLDFLGFHIQRHPQRSEPGRKALYVTPTERNIQRYRDKIHELLAEPNADVVNKLRALNQVISGWANYYRHVQSYRDRSNLDYWTFGAMFKWLEGKHGGKLGKKAIYKKYIQTNPQGQRVLGYGGVFLQGMEDVHFQAYRLPRGGIPNPYLTSNADRRITGDEPIAERTWNGLSAQNSYAIARQDLLKQQGARCQTCGQEIAAEKLQAHHKIAQSAGGKHGIENLELRCQECHTQTASYGKRA